MFWFCITILSDSNLLDTFHNFAFGLKKYASLNIPLHIYLWTVKNSSSSKTTHKYRWSQNISQSLNPIVEINDSTRGHYKAKERELVKWHTPSSRTSSRRRPACIDRLLHDAIGPCSAPCIARAFHLRKASCCSSSPKSRARTWSLSIDSAWSSGMVRIRPLPWESPGDHLFRTTKEM